MKENEVDMQKTGFVQIPVMQFLELTNAVKDYERLYNKVQMEEQEREKLLKRLVKITGQQDPMGNGERIILDFDIYALVQYLGLDKKINRDIRNANPVGYLPVVTDLQALFTDIPQTKQKVLRGINSETVS